MRRGNDYVKDVRDIKISKKDFVLVGSGSFYDNYTMQDFLGQGIKFSLALIRWFWRSETVQKQTNR